MASGAHKQELQDNSERLERYVQLEPLGFRCRDWVIFMQQAGFQKQRKKSVSN
jgi:hypothetical protein